MKKRVPIAIAAVLTACGAVATTSNDSAESAPQKRTKAKPQPRVGVESFDRGGMAGCFDPKLSGYARAAAERIGGVPCKTATSADQSGVDPWAGQYTGTAEMKIARAGPGRYSVYIDAGGPGCGGEIEGPATASGDRLTLAVKSPQPGYQQCRIMFDRAGSTLQASTSGDCYLFTGGDCSFDGPYRRSQPASATARAPSAQSSRSWLVGAWVSQGFACGGEGLIYEADGTYGTDAQSGRWQLTGNVLTETALQTVEMGEGETPIRNPRPVRSQILSVAPNRNAYTVRTTNGEVWHMVRCR
jgi:hypothetical protein